MKRRNYKGCELLPLAVSDAAQAGDAEAVEQVLRYYEGYINKLCSADDYPSDSYVFSYCGYDLPIRSQQVADAFAGLPEQEQSILILRLVLDLTDSEIGKALGLSRSAVQRRRTKSLNALRTKLTARKGG